MPSSKSGRPKSKHRHRTGSRDEDSAQQAYRTSTADSLHGPQAGQYEYMASQCKLQLRRNTVSVVYSNLINRRPRIARSAVLPAVGIRYLANGSHPEGVEDRDND